MALTKDFTRGGQTVLHTMRMVGQLIKKMLIILLIFMLLAFAYLFYVKTTPEERYLYGVKLTAQLGYSLNKQSYQVVMAPSGNKLRSSNISILQSKVINANATIVNQTLLSAIVDALLCTLLLALVIVFILLYKGRKIKQQVLLRGHNSVSPITLKWLIKKRSGVSPYRLANVPLIKQSETSHFFIHGTTGSGKSTAISQLLDEVRQQKKKAVIYDKGGEFVKHYYRPENDIILNPLDKRSPQWDPWQECRDAADFDNIAASLIPMPVSGQDPFWINGARTIFSEAAQRLTDHQDRSTITLLKFLLTSQLEQISELLSGTVAESLVSEKSEKTALSVKAVLATYLKSLQYLTTTSDPFSIRDWIKNDDQDSWLFITSQSDKKETLTPLISTWLDIACSAAMSQSPSQDRRLWLILDELPSLHRLPNLTEAFAEARKFGLCIVACMQSFAQLQHTYGMHIAKSLSDLCNTRLYFRSLDPDVTEWVSKNIGDAELEETKEGVSYGANTVRDGVSLNFTRTTKRIVLPSEIKSLNNLEAILELAGDWPVTTLRFKHKHRDSKHPAFLPRDSLLVESKELDSLLTKHQRASPFITENPKDIVISQRKDEQKKSVVQEPELSDLFSQ